MWLIFPPEDAARIDPRGGLDPPISGSAIADDGCPKATVAGAELSCKPGNFSDLRRPFS
jgi:hypothetical protein